MLSNTFSIILMLAVATASGLVGVYALMRKMTLAADAISHVALPGFGLAILFKIDPLIGGATALFLGAIIIWMIERQTQISTETVIGVIFSASLAIGSLVTPGADLIEALFGGAKPLTPIVWSIGMVAAILVVLFVIYEKDRLTLSLISRDLAVVSGINVSRMDLFFLVVFVLNVILGLQFLGALLMGSLMIVPAAVGRNLGKSLHSTMLISVAASIASVAIGYGISAAYGAALGPTIITVASAFFFLSLLKGGK